MATRGAIVWLLLQIEKTPTMSPQTLREGVKVGTGVDEFQQTLCVGAVFGGA